MPTGYLKAYIEQSHVWEANIHPLHPLYTYKFTALLRHQFHHSVHNIPPHVRVLNQIVRVNVVTVPVISVLILSSNHLSVYQMDCFRHVTHHQSVGINTHICHKHSISISPWFILELLKSISLDCERHRIEAKNIFNLRHVRMSVHLYQRGSFWLYYRKIW